jgi:pyruvate dehydrogenase E2 component (dihydrolipoamide acetyltransferase)
MAIQILMPALSPTMEEGTLSKWLVKEGDTVESGDVMAEIETDKATMEYEAVDDGIIAKILIAEGTSAVAVNTPIAVLVEEGEAYTEGETTSAPEQAPIVEVERVPLPSVTTIEKTDKGARLFATPLARRAALENGVNLGEVSGSGPRGRIIRADIEANATIRPLAKATSTAPIMGISASSDSVKAIYSDREYAEVSLNGMRKIIASRLTEAKQTIPHFYLRRSVQLDSLLAIRSEMNKGLADSGMKVSVNDFIIKASARALQDVPTANVVWAEDRILQMVASDVAVAVSVEGGLFTPVIRDSETKSLTSLSTEMKDLAGRARDKKLAPHDYQGGSFAISNLGMMGIENFDAVINPPQGSILAVGAGMKKPIVDHTGQVIVATMMSMTLSVDHRAIDGALGAEFLARISFYLENPLAMLA